MNSLTLPASVSGILLQTCCGPCASACVERLLEEGRSCVLYFSNSNLVSEEEFLRRLECVEVLARYKNGKPAVVAKKTGKALSVFSGAWQLDMEFIAEMLKRAKVYRYITTPDAFDACTDLAVLHARYPGKKVIKLPKKATVIDVENKVLVGKNIDRIESSFDLHQTKCYYFGKDAEKLLEELKQIK